MSNIYAMEVTEDVAGTEDDPLKILEEVQQALCPSQCSGRGQCENGTCLCNPGRYLGIFTTNNCYRN